MYPTDVFITAAESGLREDTKILCNQISTIDKKQLGSKIGVVPPHKMKLVDDALKISLDLK